MLYIKYPATNTKQFALVKSKTKEIVKILSEEFKDFGFEFEVTYGGYIGDYFRLIIDRESESKSIIKSWDTVERKLYTIIN